MAEENEETQNAAPKKKPNLLGIALGLQLLGLIAASGLIVKAALFTKGPDVSEKRLGERAIISVMDDLAKVQMVDLQEFKVNLPKNHVLKANIQMEVSDEATVLVVNQRIAAIKASILEVLSKQSLEMTSTFQGKLALKEALREAINKEIIASKNNAGVVREVYFVDFVLI
jgi:flagellar basal body-associated protein FliL